MSTSRATTPPPLIHPERWSILKPLIDATLDLPRERRQAYINEACAGDATLRADLERAVVECEQDSPLLDIPAAERFSTLFDESAPPPPVLADRFDIEREIGRGGMATVYLAHDRRHDRRVAVKVLRSDLAASVGVDRFLREIRTAARLQHPHILALHDSGESDGLLYYVMPYVEGETLRDRLARERALSLDEAVRITREVADALGYAHEHNVVHRDIKPENILLADGHALVADFGIARAISSAGGDTVTQAGLAIGTPAYMSPEQASADGPIDGRADTYALGCVLYEMLAGHPPFLGTTARELIAHHTLDPVPPLRTIRPDLPEAIDRALAKALAKTPADRFATAPAFAATVTRHADAPKPQRIPKRVALVVLALAVVASSYVLFSGSFSGDPPSLTSTAQPSIAVLAFRNLNSDPSNEPMSDGISEEIATTLGNVEGLSVKAPRAAFSFKGKGLSSQEIGRRLGVRYLIDGGVIRAGNQLRITVQLVLAGNDSTLWTATYQRPDSDVFAVQGEIARAVSEKLRVQFTGADRTTIATTGSPEAHELYLQGRWFFEKRDSASLAKAQGYFEQAIAKDSTYALAYAGLADSYMHRAAFGFMRANDAYREGKRHVARAISLDSSLAEVRSSSAFVATFYDWDWTTAGREFQKALQFAPTSTSAHLWNAWYLLEVDSVPAAIMEVRRALQLDPFGIVTNTRLVTFLFYSKDYKGALEQANHTFELDSNFFQIRTERARVYAQLGRCAEALVDLARSREQWAPQLVGVRGYVYAKCGRTPEAQSELDRLQAAARSGRFVAHYGLAVIHAGLGNKDQALAEVEASYHEREWVPSMLKLEPAFETLRGDARFTELVNKVKLMSSPRTSLTR